MITTSSTFARARLRRHRLASAGPVAAARGSRGPALPGTPGTASSSSRLAARNRSGEPKCCSSARLRAGPTPFSSSSTEPVIARSRRPRWWSIAKRCASSRTRCSSCEASESALEVDRLRAARDEDLLEPLGEADHGHAALGERPQRPQPGRELALAAVDHDQRGQRRRSSRRACRRGARGRPARGSGSSAAPAPPPSRRSRRAAVAARPASPRTLKRR